PAPPSEVLPPLEPQVASPTPQLTSHWPPLHTVPLWQGCPQPTQLPRSVCGFTHSSPHSICSAGQLDWQLPATQNSPAAQLVAQSPQNLGSLAGSTQS